MTMQAAVAAANRYSNWNKYYSTIRFQAVVSGAGPFTYTINGGTELRAFGYQIGADLQTVGFPANTPATLAETNLQTSAQTLAGERVRVYGMSCLLTSDSDAHLAKLLWPLLSVQLAMNGDQSVFKLGTPEMIPGSGGLTGRGTSYLVQPGLADTQNDYVSAMANGVPHTGNFYPFPQPVIWTPAGETDSNLVVRVRCERTISTISTARAGAAGVAAFVPPTAAQLGTYVTMKLHFWSRQQAARSQNM